MNTTLKAALWMTGTIASFSAMAIAGRQISLSLDTFEIMMYRSLVGVIIVCIVAGFSGTWRQINRDRLGLHLVRNVAHFTGQNLWFFAVGVAPLAQVFALEFTSPVWVILLSPLVLGERLTIVKGIAVVLGFGGVLIVLGTGLVPDWNNIRVMFASGLNGGAPSGLLAAACSAIFFAFTMMFTKRLTRTQSITCILFYLTTMQLVLGIVSAGYDGDIQLPTAQTLPFLALIGCAGLLAHFCLTKALSIAPATIVVPIDFIRLPAIAVLGMLLYGEALDFHVFLGALVIFAGNYLNIWMETRKRGLSA
jgi:drug/metabolite transporter (DMT)-like permease